MALCLSVFTLNAIISLGTFFGFISRQKARKLFEENKTLIFVLIILVLSGTFQIKLNCP